MQAQLAASQSVGLDVLWDLTHFGLPDWLDPWADDFPARLADFAGVAVTWLAAAGIRGAAWTPVNEISYWSFAGGELGHFAPYGLQRGGEWKRQLVKASLAAISRIRAVDPTARIMQPEPLTHVVDDGPRLFAPGLEAWDMRTGRLAPELGGSAIGFLC